MTLDTIKRDFGIRALNIFTLKNNVAIIINSSNEKYILKRARNSINGNLINKHRFQNELRIYKSLKFMNFRYLHTPKLFDYSKNHMVLQFIEKNKNQTVTINEFIEAYTELQQLKVAGNNFFDLKNQLLRGFYYKAFIIPFFTLRRYINIGMIIKLSFLFLKLDVTVKRLKNRYWLHGDLTPDNVFHNQLDDKLYFLDFENLIYTRKWPLIEIIQKCIFLKEDGKGVNINLSFLEEYYSKLSDSLKSDLQKLDLRHQFRFSTLMLCINNIAMAKSPIKRNTFIELLKVTLNKKQFDIWFKSNVESNFIIDFQSSTRLQL